MRYYLRFPMDIKTRIFLGHSRFLGVLHCIMQRQDQLLRLSHLLSDFRSIRWSFNCSVNSICVTAWSNCHFGLPFHETFHPNVSRNVKLVLKLCNTTPLPVNIRLRNEMDILFSYRETKFCKFFYVFNKFYFLHQAKKNNKTSRSPFEIAS